jgi:hypothetical protein
MSSPGSYPGGLVQKMKQRSTSSQNSNQTGISPSGTKQKIPVANVKPIICPFAGKRCFNDSAYQPLVRRHTPIFQNHRHRYGGGCVHEQTRARHDRNAKKAAPGCTNFLDSGTGSGRFFSEDADFFGDFVPRHLKQKRKKNVLFFYWLHHFTSTHYHISSKKFK